MKQTETDKNFYPDPELDTMLDQMAEEVPPMPADFHDKWMNAIREEAKQNVPAAEDKAEKKAVSVMRWTRMLSIAAVFLFLIGGTILYRNSRGSLMPVLNAGQMDTAVMTDEVPAAVEEPEAERTEEAAEADQPFRRKETVTLMAAAGSIKESAMNETAVNSTDAAEAYGDNEAMATGAVVEEAAEAAYDTAEEPMPLPLMTGMPTEPVFEQTEAVAEETFETGKEEPEKTATGLLRQAGEFMTDMGDFLLAALPYLAVLAVPAVFALILRQRKKNRGKQGDSSRNGTV